MQRVRIIGAYLSPYVRKVLACLELKSIPYEIDPIVPFMGDERFSQVSPIRRVPVLIDERVTLADSSVICQYLEDLHPEPRLYPTDVADRARARWLEEYADSRMGEVVIWRLFNQVAIRPAVWGERPDPAVLERARNEEMPQILDYLESQAPADGYCFGALSIADISIASFFRNAELARYRIDAARWPRTAALVDRVLALECFRRLSAYEACCMRTPIAGHREALAAMGAPLTGESFGSDVARRGVMRID